jgi:4-diphosphocytidyl-2-C-methyl-D-erythritol kinase
VIEAAPAKVNLCLYVGPLRADGRHEFLSVIQSIELADRLELVDHPEGGEVDEVRCAGVAGPNLAAAALAAFRARSGWDGPAQLLVIEKAIPVAAGLGGGSADAAAALRLIARRSGRGDDALLLEIAAGLGSDVPSQIRPGRVLATGAGEVVAELADPQPFGVLVLPSRAQLSTAAVYAEADRLGLARAAGELELLRAGLDPAAPAPWNDLEAAARSLEPSIDGSLALAREAGAGAALVSGSGPTVVGLFADPAGARDAAAALAAGGVDATASAALLRHNWGGHDAH